MIRKKDVPPSYNIIKKNKTVIVLRDDCKETLLKMGIDGPEFFLAHSSEKSDEYYGRGALKTLALPEPGKERVVIRHYRRGGKVQKFITDLYWGSSRPLRELWVGYQAMEKGIPTAEILAVCHTQVFWKFHRGDLVSREIMNGKDLANYLKGLPQPLSKENILQKRKVIETVGNLVRKLHDGGIFHGDLNLKNIILQISRPRTIKGYIIDFDKSFIKSTLSENMRIRNLLRLNRSAEKFKREGLPLTRSDTLRFLLSYYQNPFDFKTLLKDLNRRYERHLRFHCLGKKILSLF
ncbi:MAG: hypothetical protein JRJ08_01750 [Deltaproteobacteria bacterium]|nr:hypothetical protein [Deltaproteobacteria bacterium]